MATQYANGRIVSDGLVLCLSAADKNSYPGSGTTWTDLNPFYTNSTLTNGPTFSPNNSGLVVLDGTNDWISIPGSTTLYSSNFTWQSFHYIRSANSGDLDAMWWSEAGGFGKNFLTGYRNTGLVNPYFRIDTPSATYQSPAVGTQYNGLGTNAGSVAGRWLLTTIVKNGTTFSLYWNNAIIMWQVTISDWSIPYTSQAIAFGARNDSSFATAMNISSILMYNKALSTPEIIQNYEAQKTRFNLI